jgi:hypothetical protein
MPRPELSADKEFLVAFCLLGNESIRFVIPITPPLCHQLANSFTTLWEAKTQFVVLLRVFSHWIADAYAWGSRLKEVGYPVPGCKPMPEYTFAEQRQSYLSAFRQWNKTLQVFFREYTEVTSTT